jgi:thiamine pyrophosphokinase
MRVVIIANGEPPSPADVHEWLRPGDVLACADGGARVALALGQKPHIVIGDFDSLSPAELDRLAACGSELRRHPPQKDETDLELVLLWAAEFLAGHPEPQRHELTLLGATGGRTDQTLANLMLLALPGLRTLNVVVASGNERMQLIQPEHPCDLHGMPGDTVSLLPLGGDARGVRTRGLHYPLDGDTLRFGPARGVSNVMRASRASISVQAGCLLCIHTVVVDGAV